MADLTYEILTDREQYPDDQEIALANGKKTTVKAMRDALMPKADFTRASETWAQDKRRLEGDLNQRQQQADALAQQLSEAMKEKTVTPSRQPGTFSEEELLQDAVVGPILKRNIESAAEIREIKEQLKAHERYALTREYAGRLNALEARHNSRFNSDGKGKGLDLPAFHAYMQQNPIFRYNPMTQKADEPDIETMYEKFVRNDEISWIEKRAEARGEERGRQTHVPAVPFGRRRTPVRDKNLPESFEQVTDEQIANDPEILEAMQKDAEG